jgi:hypothetical protein
MDVSTHYVDNEFEFNSRTLSVKPWDPEASHTASNILSVFKDILAEFRLKNFGKYFVVTDSASNMIKGEGLTTVFELINCSDHKLSTFLKRVFSKQTRADDNGEKKKVYIYYDDAPEIFKLLDACHALVAYASRSGMNGKLKYGLKSFSDTRWLGLGVSLESIDISYSEVASECATKNKSHLLAAINKDLLSSLVKLLKRYNEVILKLECHTSPTIHLVCNEFHLLFDDALQPKETDCKSIQAVKKALLNERNERLKFHDLHKIAAWLDPRQKNHLPQIGFTATEVSEMPLKIENTIMKLWPNVAVRVEEPSPKKRSDNFNFPVPVLSYSDKIRNEIASYTMIVLDSTMLEDFNILQFWKNNSACFPILTKLARTVLAIPASSSKAETDFSSAGFIKSPRRSCMLPETLDDILVCKGNKDLLK